MKTPTPPIKGSIFVLLCTVTLHAGQVDHNKQGTVAASFLQASPSVRQAALGGEQVALSHHVDDGFSNPAALTSLDIPELWVSHHQSFIDSTQDSALFGWSGKSNSFAVGGQYNNEGSLDKTGEDNGGNPIQGLGTFRPYSGVVQFSWARKTNERLSMGATLKSWKEQLSATSNNGFAGDVGVLWAVNPKLNFGLAYRNVGPGSNGYSLPSNLSLGLGYALNSHLSIYSEADHAAHRGLGLRGGVELKSGSVFLRGGYQNLTNELSDPLSSFSMGAGIRIKGLVVDYAWAPKGDLGDQHRFSLNVGFGRTAEEKEAAARELDLVMTQRMKDNGAAHMAKGQKAVEMNDWAQASKEFSSALLWDPENNQLQQKFAYSQKMANEAEIETHFQEGKNFASNQHWIDAASAWNNVLKLDPTHKGAKKALDSIALQLGGSSKQDANYEKGISFYINGDYEDALRRWSTLSNEGNRYPKLDEYMAKAKAKKLEGELSQVMAKRPSREEEVNALSQHAYTLYTVGQTEKAIQIWEKILALDAHNQDARQALTNARERKDLNAFAPAKRNVQMVQDLNVRALSNYSEGKLENAIEIWQQAAAIDPTNIKIKGNLKRAEQERAARGAQ